MSEAQKTILVIDDDEVFAQTLARGLQRKGFEVHVAHASVEALEIARSNQPDSAILDLRLGDESGLQLIQPLLTEQPDLRIVVLTGFASLATAVQAVKLGAVNYLAKPVNVDAILVALDETKPVVVDASEDFSPTPLKQLEWEHIQRVLAENDGNISATARQLGMHRRTLQRKLQKKPDLSNQDKT